MKRLLKVLAILIVLIAGGLLARQFLCSAVRIQGASMESTLVSGDVVLVLRFDRSADCGDVIECRFRGRDGRYVKRVIGQAGDSITCTDGVLTRNGTPIPEPYVSSSTEDFQAVVGKNEIYVLGDNRAESYDSRAADMGCIQTDGCLGRVCWILWPPNRFGPIE